MAKAEYLTVEMFEIFLRHQTAEQIGGNAEREALLKIVQRLAEKLPNPDVDGMSIEQVFYKLKADSFERQLVSLEDKNPGEVALLQEQIDALRRKFGAKE